MGLRSNDKLSINDGAIASRKIGELRLSLLELIKGQRLDIEIRESSLKGCLETNGSTNDRETIKRNVRMFLWEISFHHFLVKERNNLLKVLSKL